MVSSFILTPDYFVLPEIGKVARESGIENRYNRAFENVDPNFSVNKDDWSDGVIRYTVNGEVKFYGIQECKVDEKKVSINERIVQSLVYIYDWTKTCPELKSKFKFVILPTDKQIDLLFLDNLLNSIFWTEFCFYYNEHRLLKGSASTFYKKSADVRALICDYLDRLKKIHFTINNSLDFKDVVEPILNECL